LDNETVDFSVDESNLLEILSNKLPSYFQKPVKSINRDYLVIDNESNKIYRLLSYVEGDLLVNAPHTKELFESFGKLLAKMDNELMGKRYLSIMSRKYDWDILQFDLNVKNIQYIEDIEVRRIVEYFHLQFHEVVRPLLPEMRYSIIHGDANDLNVLVDINKVSGIIDFGDSSYSILINELAVAITYAVLDKENPIEWASPIIKGYSEVIPLTETEVDILYYLIAARLSISLCHSAYGRKINPTHKYLTVSEKPVLALIKKWITINPLKATNEFRKAAGLPEIIKDTTEIDIKKRWSLLSKAFSMTYEKPIKMEKAAFQYMYDNQGNTYLDLRNNIPHVGHCHPQVVRAGQRAMVKLNTNTRYIYDEIHSYSEKLLAKFPKSLNKVFFVNSGSAASDLAIRLAKTHTKKKNIMVMEHGYHGNTSTAIEISHYKFSGKGGKGTPENTLIAPIPASNLKLTQQEKEKINTEKLSNFLNVIRNKKNTIAGFITEPIVSAAGQIVIEKHYLQKIYEFIRSQGGVCISDEVQTGFGRLGNYFWGFEYAEVIPNIVVLGKPIANGHPMAAVVCTTEIAESFNNGMEFFSSFGGNPISCAIGEAVLDVIENEDLARNAKIVGDYLIEEFKLLREKCEYIGEIRGMGLSLGVEIIKDIETLEPNTELAAFLVSELKGRNILVGTDGPFDNVFKLKPPLCFTKENANTLINELKSLLICKKIGKA
jgi:ethanolamine-phosphate phospho-lyase